MNQVIKEECPYCEKYITSMMCDTTARKATRFATSKGITTVIKHGVDVFVPGAGFFVANGVKILAGNHLDKAGKFVESQVFETGDFVFNCPNCGHHWKRQIPHSAGNVTLCIDHDYVKKSYADALSGRFSMIFVSIIVSALNLGLLYLCYGWCSGLESTTMEHYDGLFGMGAKDYEAVNYTFYFAWFLFICGVVSNLFSIIWISDKVTAWRYLKNMDFKLYRFRLLTNQEIGEGNVTK